MTPPHDALTDCRHMVSGTLSLPSRGTFHHSLTVLIHYRSIGSIQAYQVVLADSHGAPRTPCYSGSIQQQHAHFQLRDYHPLRSGIHTSSSSTHTHCVARQHNTEHTQQPPPRNPCRVSHVEGLASSAFARHY